MSTERIVYKFVERDHLGGIQREYTFPNGYGASVVKFPGSYGYKQDKWELALLKDGVLLYEPPIFEDVIGYLTSKDVDRLLQQISMFDKKTFKEK